jgi:NCS1 family nucleobase:cation symporter-1
VAVAPCVPGFLHTVGLIASVPPIWDRLYTYAWFLTFALAFLLYGLLMIGNRSVKQEK